MSRLRLPYHAVVLTVQPVLHASRLVAHQSPRVDACRFFRSHIVGSRPCPRPPIIMPRTYLELRQKRFQRSYPSNLRGFICIGRVFSKPPTLSNSFDIGDDSSILSGPLSPTGFGPSKPLELSESGRAAPPSVRSLAAGVEVLADCSATSSSVN